LPLHGAWWRHGAAAVLRAHERRHDVACADAPRRDALDPAGKTVATGTPSARAMASAVATVGSALPFFTWVTQARSMRARAGRSTSVQCRSARSLAIAFRISGAARGATTALRPGRRGRPQAARRAPAADWHPAFAAARGRAPARAPDAQAPPAQSRAAQAAPAAG